MKIELKLYASLTHHMPEQKAESGFIEVREGMTIGEVLDYLKIPGDAIKIIFLNGVHAKVDEIPKEGDRLGVFPPVAGG
ncbi:MAG: MoaD/ThiS family protein [Pseudomonadota bacterium]